MDESGTNHIYHAHASGAAGNIVFPLEKKQNISSQAATSLSPMGGDGAQEVRGFKIDGILSFRSAQVKVSGRYNETENAHVTSSSAVIEDLDVMGVVKADRIEARLLSHHRKANGNVAPEPTIVADGSAFTNLRINGHPINVELTTPIFSQLDTFSAIQKAYQKSGDMWDWLVWSKVQGAGGVHPSLDRFRDGLGDLPKKGLYMCSAANHLDLTGSGLKNFGSVIHVPGFGVIHLAELLVAGHSRRMHMIRIHLGSPVVGDISICTAFTNGTTYPPTSGGHG